ncbi:MAG TPA: FHA domain-containing protein [Planctomycetota bacterium]|nr:FHA domain-containing protein [Planctomycetota bacterium]
MSDEPSKKIVITSEDVNSREVDAALSQQMSFGMPAEALAKDRSAWYYRSWFVLMLAGALGAFLAWCLFEPFYDDHLTVLGNVESADPDARLPGVPDVQGRLTVSGTSVWLLGADGKMDLGDGAWKPMNPTVFRTGQVVEARGEASVGQHPLLVAMRIRVHSGDPRTYPPADLPSLNWRNFIAGLLIFPIVAGLVGLAIGSADGILSRAYGRGIVCGLVGLAMGLVVGTLASIAATLLYSVFGGIVQHLDRGSGMKMSTGAFILQMMNRGLAWALAGVAMGMGQGIALRSKKLFFNGLIGGVVGGLLGGLLFDPINYLMGGGQFAEDASSSRAVGFVTIGLVTGLMVGIVELIAREAWLKMLAGPLAGKEFVLYKDPTSIGSSPKREVYLFKDPEVEPVHALIHRVGEGYELEDKKSPGGTLLNGRKVSRQRLKSQDQIRIGSTVLLFTMKED